MATLQNRIQLDDGVTGVLSRIENAAGGVISAFNRMETAIGNIGTNPALTSMLRSLSGIRLNINIPNLSGSAAQLSRIADEVRGLREPTTRAALAFRNLRNTINIIDPTQLSALNRIRINNNFAGGFNGFASAIAPLERTMRSIAVIMGRIAAQIAQVASNTRNAAGGARELRDGLGGAAENASMLDRFLGSAFGQFTLANLATSAIEGLIGAVAGLPGRIFDTAQEYAGIESKMRLVVGSQEKVAEMNDMIYRSALRSNASFETMADSVAKIGLTAKEAFPDPEEIVPFMEGINKLMAIGGTTGINASATMLQLTQALGSGVLQGDEFRSIAENAPLIEKMVAKEMSKQTGQNITQGMLKNLASEGLVTADLIKQAVLNNMDEINSQFGNAAVTAGARWENLGTIAYRAFIPVFQKINDIFNSPAMGEFVSKIGAMLPIVANEVLFLLGCFFGVADAIWSVVTTAYDLMDAVGVFDILKLAISNLPALIIGIGAAFLVMKVQAIASFAVLIVNQAKMAIGFVATTIAAWQQTAATIAAAYATGGLSAALAACPITWIAAAVLALVVVFYIVIAAINHFADTSISATGIIFGVFGWLFAGIHNLIGFVWNIFIAFAQFLANVFVDPLTATRNLFAMIWNNVVDLVAQAVNNIIDLISKIPGMDKVMGDLGTSVADIKSSLTMDIKPIEGGVDLSGYQMSMASSNDWANKGYDMGANLDQKFAGFADFKLPEPEKLPSYEQEWGDREWKESETGNEEGKDKNGAKTAKNTGKMAGTLDIMEEDIRFMRDYANQEAIDQYTTASVKISMGGITNNVSSEIDLDGITNRIADGLLESMQAGAEKVHAL